MRTVHAVTAILLLTGCSRTPVIDEQAYRDDLAQYRQARVDELTQPGSWLSLAGLFWLDEGDNTLGADPASDLVFPEGKSAASLGLFHRADTTVSFIAAPRVDVLYEGQPVDTLMLVSDAHATPTILHYGTLSWYVVRRGERLGVRLKDAESPTLIAFHGLDTYPPALDWRVEGTFERYDPPRPIPILDITGVMADQQALGALVFEHDGTPYRLDVIRDGDEPRFFLIFGDRTNGPDTYGAGRYLKVEEPAPASNRVVIDFNRAYNPPCAFTPFATCPLPPQQNKLPFRVEAGEKKYVKAGPEA